MCYSEISFLKWAHKFKRPVLITRVGDQIDEAFHFIARHSRLMP